MSYRIWLLKAIASGDLLLNQLKISVTEYKPAIPLVLSLALFYPSFQKD